MRKGQISNGVFFKDPSPELVREVLALFTYENPAYISAKIFSPYSVISAKIPQYISHAFYDEDRRILHAPRGLEIGYLSNASRKEIAKYDFADLRRKSPVTFPSLLITPNKEQTAMIKAFRAARKAQERPFGNYLFFASTSLGKTMLQAIVASMTKQRTLVICQTNLIRDAWWRDLYTAFGIPKRDIGLIQQSTWRVGEFFTLASIATLHRREKRWRELFKTFGTVVVDECFPAGTKVDGFPIESLREGDFVSSWNHSLRKVQLRKITKTFKSLRVSPLVQITLEGGISITATPLHPIWNGISYIPACELTASDLVWVDEKYKNSEMPKLRKSCDLLGDQNPQLPKQSGGQEKPSLLLRTVQIRISEAIEVRELQESSGCAGERNEGRKKSHEVPRFPEKNEKHSYHDEVSTSDSGREWEDNARPTDLASSCPRKPVRSRVSDTDSLEASRLSGVLQNRHSASTLDDCGRNKREQPLFLSGQTEGLEENRILKILRVESVHFLEQGSNPKSSVVRENDYVYNIEVEENSNYFAEGILVHNCHTISEPRLCSFVAAIKSKYVIGATATGDKEDGTNHPLYAHLGEPVSTVKIRNVDTATSMALRKVRVVKTKFDYSYDPHNLDMHDLSISLAADDARNELIVENAYRDWKKGRSVVITVKRVPHIHLLAEMLKERGIKDTNVLYGGTNRKSYTEKLVAAFNARKTRMIVANYQSIKLGGNLNPMNSLHLAWPVNSTDLEQIIGRIRRKASGKVDSELVYYLDTQVEWLHRRYHAKAVPLFREMEIEGFKNVF